MTISLGFKVRDARETLKFLQEIPRGEEQPFERQLRDVLADALTNYDAGARAKKLDRVQREKWEKEQQEATAKCTKRGHAEPTCADNGLLLDCQTIADKAVSIPTCLRCGKSIVHLTDGTWMEWIKWAETKPLLELDPKFRGHEKVKQHWISTLFFSMSSACGPYFKETFTQTLMLPFVS
jgi:hypothetical protein